MRIKKIVAFKIWQIRQELEIAGSDTHDWWLTDQFLQIAPDRFNDDDIYTWFMQLEENLIPKERLDNYLEI